MPESLSNQIWKSFLGNESCCSKLLKICNSIYLIEIFYRSTVNNSKSRMHGAVKTKIDNTEI